MLDPKRGGLSTVDDEEMLEDREPLDAQAGYMIGIKVHGDGSLTVCKKPLPTEDEKSAYDEMSVESIEQALKAALKLYKTNPVGSDQQAAFAAGFGGLNNQSSATEGHGLMAARY